MRPQLMLYVLGALAFACVAEESACITADDADDDRCQLLQVDVVSHHGEDHHDQYHAKSIEHAQGDSEGWPDILKKVTDVLGGADKLEEDFDGIKTAVAAFKEEVHTEITSLLGGVDTSMSIDAIRQKVETTYENIYEAAKKLWEALEKVTATFVTGVGKVVPQQFKSSFKSTLGKVSDQGKLFADGFKNAAEGLKQINKTVICAKVKQGLHTVLQKASELAQSATGLDSKGLSKEIKAAKDALPDALKKQIEKMLHKANDAADHILSSITPAMKEIAHGVAKAFKGHCTGLPHSGAGRLEVGLLWVLVLSVLSFSM